MSISSRVAKRQRSLGEKIVITVLLTTLMTHFISYFLEQKSHITDTGFSRLSNNFFTKITVVRSKWIIDNKPQWVDILSRSNISNEGERSAEHIPVKITVGLTSVLIMLIALPSGNMP